MAVVRIILLFLFNYEGIYYPCALVEWFRRVKLDPVTGMWVVCPDMTEGIPNRLVLHLDSFLHGAHLIPVYGDEALPIDFHYSYSLDAFKAFYVNKFIDHHAHEIVF